VSDPSTRRARRLAAALVLVVVATVMVLVEPFPQGAVLVSLTRTHGVDAGDLPAVALYLLAGVLALWPT
jgi:hypothetical protein